MPMVDLLIILTRQHIPKMQDTRIMRQRNLIPVIFSATYFTVGTNTAVRRLGNSRTVDVCRVSDNLCIAAVLRTDRFSECGTVF